MGIIAGERTPLQGDDATSFTPRPPRALVVDDHHTTLKVVYNMMTALGYHVDSANGGLAAMYCARNATYDLVLANLEMVKMDGYSLAGWLKHSTQGTKVVVMTECCHSEVANYMDTGVVDWWIFKPFSLNKLAAVVHDVVQNKVQANPCRRASSHARLFETLTLLDKADAVQARLAERRA